MYEEKVDVEQIIVSQNISSDRDIEVASQKKG